MASRGSRLPVENQVGGATSTSTEGSGDSSNTDGNSSLETGGARISVAERARMLSRGTSSAPRPLPERPTPRRVSSAFLDHERTGGSGAPVIPARPSSMGTTSTTTKAPAPAPSGSNVSGSGLDTSTIRISVAERMKQLEAKVSPNQAKPGSEPIMRRASSAVLDKNTVRDPAPPIPSRTASSRGFGSTSNDTDGHHTGGTTDKTSSGANAPPKDAGTSRVNSLRSSLNLTHVGKHGSTLPRKHSSQASSSQTADEESIRGSSDSPKLSSRDTTKEKEEETQSDDQVGKGAADELGKEETSKSEAVSSSTPSVSGLSALKSSLNLSHLKRHGSTLPRKLSSHSSQERTESDDGDTGCPDTTENSTENDTESVTETGTSSGELRHLALSRPTMLGGGRRRRPPSIRSSLLTEDSADENGTKEDVRAASDKNDEPSDTDQSDSDAPNKTIKEEDEDGSSEDSDDFEVL